MSGTSASGGVLAIDIGSSRTKLGWFAPPGACEDKPATELPIAAPKLPEPTLSFAVECSVENCHQGIAAIRDWVEQELTAEAQVFFASVRPNIEAPLVEMFGKLGWNAPRKLTYQDLPLEIRVDAPEKVGIDRLLNAVAVNRLRDPATPAIVVDLGTAGTVDLVATDGAFEGGAIIPGVTLSARALHGATASLPELERTEESETIPAVGKNTKQAIASGLHWGAVGAVTELVTRIAQECEVAPQLFATGGGVAAIVPYLGTQAGPAKHVPHMILSTICTIARQSE